MLNSSNHKSAILQQRIESNVSSHITPDDGQEEKKNNSGIAGREIPTDKRKISSKETSKCILKLTKRKTRKMKTDKRKDKICFIFE